MSLYLECHSSFAIMLCISVVFFSALKLENLPVDSIAVCKVHCHTTNTGSTLQQYMFDVQILC